MATIKHLLIRRFGSAQLGSEDDLGPEWKQFKTFPANDLFEPKSVRYLSKVLDAEVVACILQTNSSVFLFSRCDRGVLKRYILTLEDVLTEGEPEPWESEVKDPEDESAGISLGEDVIGAIEKDLGVTSLAEVPYTRLSFNALSPKGMIRFLPFDSFGGPRWLIIALGLLIFATAVLLTYGIVRRF